MTGFSCRASTVALALGLVVAISLAAPGAAQAGTATLKRSTANLLLFPFDFALSPFVATRATYNNWRSSDDTRGVKYAYPVFGVPWMISVNLGASVLRGLAGALELLPGIVLLPFDTDMAPLYDLSENNPALYDSGEDSPWRLRVGVDYVSPSEL